MAIPAEIDGYDWEQAFQVAMRDGIFPVEGQAATPELCAPFTREDVKTVLGAVEGENDETDWVCVVELHDGRFAIIQSGCDYTGWG